MQLDMNFRQAGFDDDSSLRAERLLRLSLSRFHGAVSRVKVTFVDLDRPKGGGDKRCLITARMKTSRLVVARNDGLDYIEALSFCLEKLVRAIRRDIDGRITDPIRKNRIYAKS